MSKVCSAEDAIALIPDGATVAVCGTGPVLLPDILLSSLEQRFVRTGQPRGLRVLPAMSVGDQSGEGGLNHIAHPAMVQSLIVSSMYVHRHPALTALLRRGEIEGYIVGMGAMIQMFAAAAAGKPGVLTQAGLDTFLDPRIEGGRMNCRSDDPPVELVNFDGAEYLYHGVVPVDFAIIRATTADENGYLTFEEETNTLGVAEIAAAAKASGGAVAVQVKRIVPAGSLDPLQVRIPGPLVDHIVVNPRQTQLGPTMQKPGSDWDPSLVSADTPSHSVHEVQLSSIDNLVLGRAMSEISAGSVLNVGAGLPTRLPILLEKRGVLDDVTVTNEHGIFGGLLATSIGGSFVPGVNPRAIMDSSFQFNFYESGGLDVAFLGAGEVGANGDVNVSKFGRHWNGPGGLCSITLKTRKIVFCTSFTSGGLEVSTGPCGVEIVREGDYRTFVDEVEQVTFSASRAVNQGQEVLYITERCVFQLTEAGLELIEVAPGIDIDLQIRAHIPFDFRVREELNGSTL